MSVEIKSKSEIQNPPSKFQRYYKLKVITVLDVFVLKRKIPRDDLNFLLLLLPTWTMLESNSKEHCTIAFLENKFNFHRVATYRTSSEMKHILLQQISIAVSLAKLRIMKHCMHNL